MFLRDSLLCVPKLVRRLCAGQVLRRVGLGCLLAICLLVSGCGSSSSSGGSSPASEAEIDLTLVKHPFFAQWESSQSSAKSVDVSGGEAASQAESDKATGVADITPVTANGRVEIDFYQLVDNKLPSSVTFSKSYVIPATATSIRIYGIPSKQKYEIRGRIYNNSQAVPYAKFRSTADLSVDSVAKAEAVLTSAVLKSIQVSPSVQRVSCGYSQAFKAMGLYQDATTEDITSSVTWKSFDTSICALNSNIAGCFRSLTSGKATITALESVSQISGSASLEVIDGVALSGLSLEPAITSLPLGVTQQLQALGVFSDGITCDVANDVEWSTSDASVVSVDNLSTPGLIQGLEAGSATITAYDRLSGITVTLPIEVVDSDIVSIAVSPASLSWHVGLSKQFSATGTFSDGSQCDLTAVAHWSSSEPAILSVSDATPDQGRALAVSGGSATVQASFTSAHGTTVSSTSKATTIAATLQSLVVAPAEATIFPNTTQQFSATCYYSDKLSEDVTGEVQWESSDESVATISNLAATAGLVAGIAPGSTEIKASYSGTHSSTATLTVEPVVLESIAVSPTSSTVIEQLTLPFAAVGSYTDGSTVDITKMVEWRSSSPAAATIVSGGDKAGVATGVAPGETAIVAVYAGVESPAATLTVVAKSLIGLKVSPESSTVHMGCCQIYTATGTYDNGTTADLSGQVAWQSSDNTKAEVSVCGDGIVRANTYCFIFDAVTIKASYGGFTSSAALLADNSGIQVDLGSGRKLTMRWSPAGMRKLGCETSEIGYTGDENVRDVTLTYGYWIAETEVTQDQYLVVTQTNPSVSRVYADNPVDSVTYSQAQTFCSKLQKPENIPFGYSFHLPTEAQWEYACRGYYQDTPTASLNTGDSIEHAIGEDTNLGKAGWYLENSADTTQIVARKSANLIFAFDFHGNVAEWCSDWYHAYSSTGETDPTGPSSEQGQKGRVIRGGSFKSEPAACRSAARAHSGNVVEPHSDNMTKFSDVGFRPVLAH